MGIQGFRDLVKADGSVARRGLSSRANDIGINVADEFQLGDADYTNAWERAVVRANSKVRATIYFPAGEFQFGNSALTLPTVPCTIKGAGMEATLLKWPENSHLFSRAGSESLGSHSELAFTEFTVEGVFPTVGKLATSTNIPINVYWTDFVSIHRVGLRKVHYFGFVLRGDRKVSVTECQLFEVARDGISCMNCEDVTVANNAIDHCDDDGISCQTTSTTVGPRVSLVVVGNRLADSGGISIGGNRRMIVGNNRIVRPTLRGIGITYSSGLGGYAPPVAISITGNVITDCINRNGIDGLANAHQYISINAITEDGALAAIPGRNDTNTGTIVSLYDHIEIYGETEAQGGAYWLNVSGNVCSRTLPLATNYSDWGYGQYFTRNGYLNPAITAAELYSAAVGVNINGGVRNALITGNVINGMNYGVFLASTLANYRNVRITNNLISDFATAGVGFSGSISNQQEIVIDYNLFDGDPFHVNGNRAANGTWTASGAPTAVLFNSIAGGVEMKFNNIKNVCRPIELSTTAGNDKVLAMNNILECDPTALAFSTSNKGIGFVPRSGAGWIFKIIDSDPASATYGDTLNLCQLEKSAIPTAGKYVTGHFVHNNSPAIAAGKILIGWIRLTIGSGHVSSTDWAPVFGTTS